MPQKTFTLVSKSSHYSDTYEFKTSQNGPFNCIFIEVKVEQYVDFTFGIRDNNLKVINNNFFTIAFEQKLVQRKNDKFTIGL